MFKVQGSGVKMLIQQRPADGACSRSRGECAAGPFSLTTAWELLKFLQLELLGA